jgi:hypothetical protein
MTMYTLGELVRKARVEREVSLEEISRSAVVNLAQTLRDKRTCAKKNASRFEGYEYDGLYTLLEIENTSSPRTVRDAEHYVKSIFDKLVDPYPSYLSDSLLYIFKRRDVSLKDGAPLIDAMSRTLKSIEAETITQRENPPSRAQKIQEYDQMKRTISGYISEKYGTTFR